MSPRLVVLAVFCLAAITPSVFAQSALPLVEDVEAGPLRRAGVDYWSAVEYRRHATLEEFESSMKTERIFCLSAHAVQPYTCPTYQPGDVFLFGGESHGLPNGVVRRYGERALCIPMPSGKVRSLNLATAVGIVLYEALRQLHSW